MNTEQFIEKMKNIKVNVPDEDFFLEYNKTVYDILDNQEKLIKYIEDKINICKYDLENLSKNYNAYFREIDITKNLLLNLQDLLERIKSNNYE